MRPACPSQKVDRGGAGRRRQAAVARNVTGDDPAARRHPDRRLRTRYDMATVPRRGVVGPASGNTARHASIISVAVPPAVMPDSPTSTRPRQGVAGDVRTTIQSSTGVLCR
ncbi:hypothetical protein GCM10010524_19380 [Streptomyces mexicanus]